MTDPRSSLPASTGVPQPFEAPVAPAPTMPASTSGVSPAYAAAPNPKRPMLSKRARVCLVIILVVRALTLINRFISSAVSGYFMEIMALWGTWLWTAFDILVIVLALLALMRQSNPIRFVTAGFVLFMRLVAAPMLVEVAGGNWYTAYIDSLFMQDSDVVASLGFLTVARLLLMWVLGWCGTIAAVILVIPDRKASAVPQQGAVTAPGAAPVGYYPHAAAPAGQVPLPSAVPEGASSEAVPEASSAQVTNASGFAAPQ